MVFLGLPSVSGGKAVYEGLVIPVKVVKNALMLVMN
jgi:hypothetical protein